MSVVNISRNNPIIQRLIPKAFVKTSTDATVTMTKKSYEKTTINQIILLNGIRNKYVNLYTNKGNKITINAIRHVNEDYIAIDYHATSGSTQANITSRLAERGEIDKIVAQLHIDYPNVKKIVVGGDFN